jgi:putative glutamine amidotransferase
MRGSPPLIGITADLSGILSHRTQSQSEPTLFLPQRYVSAVERAGAIAVILPAHHSSRGLKRYMNLLDGLVISGGNFDIHPHYYGEKPINQLGIIKPQRTEFELELAMSALKRDMPVLGICGGAQAINVVLGGSLYQDIAAQLPDAAEHQQSARKTVGGHRVQVQDGTRLRKIIGRQSLEVNTTHHQAIKKLGRGLVVNAVADDGIVEGIESTQHDFVLGLQWHPEVLAPRQKLHRRIFFAFATTCRKHKAD